MTDDMDERTCETMLSASNIHTQAMTPTIINFFIVVKQLIYHTLTLSFRNIQCPRINAFLNLLVGIWSHYGHPMICVTGDLDHLVE